MKVQAERMEGAGWRAFNVEFELDGTEPANSENVLKGGNTLIRTQELWDPARDWLAAICGVEEGETPNDYETWGKIQTALRRIFQLAREDNARVEELEQENRQLRAQVEGWQSSTEQWQGQANRFQRALSAIEHLFGLRPDERSAEQILDALRDVAEDCKRSSVRLQSARSELKKVRDITTARIASANQRIAELEELIQTTHRVRRLENAPLRVTASSVFDGDRGDHLVLRTRSPDPERPGMTPASEPAPIQETGPWEKAAAAVAAAYAGPLMSTLPMEIVEFFSGLLSTKVRCAFPAMTITNNVSRQDRPVDGRSVGIAMKILLKAGIIDFIKVKRGTATYHVRWAILPPGVEDIDPSEVLHPSDLYDDAVEIPKESSMVQAASELAERIFAAVKPLGAVSSMSFGELRDLAGLDVGTREIMRAFRYLTLTGRLECSWEQKGSPAADVIVHFTLMGEEIKQATQGGKAASPVKGKRLLLAGASPTRNDVDGIAKYLEAEVDAFPVTSVRERARLTNRLTTYDMVIICSKFMTTGYAKEILHACNNAGIPCLRHPSSANAQMIYRTIATAQH